ncbi:MAG TPA: transposase, partial [Candidatus Babeliaceae bacterium]|nr:transposase [Candidatus Babeliaceae bacterium]
MLYQIVEEYYPQFISQLEDEGRSLPAYVKKEFEEYLRCGILQHGFLRVQCGTCKHEKMVAFSCKKRGFCPSCGAKRMIESAALLVDDILTRQPYRQWVLSVPYPLRFLFANQPVVLNSVLKIVHRTIETYLIKKAGFNKKKARTGAVTYIQRFGSALNLNLHPANSTGQVFHMLFLGGVFVEDANQKQRFVTISQPKSEEIVHLTHQLSLRVARHLERIGFIERDAENSYLVEDAFQNNEMAEHQSHSINYRIAMGPQKGKKVFRLQTVAPITEEATLEIVGKVAGFSLHAGVVVKANQRDKLERICRYIARPAISNQRLSLTPQGKIRYELKTPYRDGTTHIFFEPLDFISKLAALVPPPKVNLIRFIGVFAPNNKHREEIVNRKKAKKSTSVDTRTEGEKRVAMTGAKNIFKRAFKIDINICEK